MLLIVAANFRDLRKQQKLTQQDVAERSGVSLITVKRFEASGSITFELLLKMAHALDALEAFGQLFPPRNLPDNLDDLFSDKTKS